MGTRADFYVGRGVEAEWLGSFAWDGHPQGIDSAVLLAGTESTFREEVSQMLRGREDSTVPSQGWPWPWNDSRTTDFAYALDGDMVWSSLFSSEWFDPLQSMPEDLPENVAVFPDMSDRKNVARGFKRSGLIVMSMPKRSLS